MLLVVDSQITGFPSRKNPDTDRQNKEIKNAYT